MVIGTEEHTEQSTERVSNLERARWITHEQLVRIEKFVSSSGGRVIRRPPAGDRESYGPTIYELDGEPLVVMNKVSKSNPNHVGWVFPSEKHAKKIQDLGIIDFDVQEGDHHA